MKKSQNSLPDSRSESVELSIRLYRAIGDIVRHLDDKRSRIGNVRDMFSENIELQRIKLKDYCEKLMFVDPVRYGKKAEELLWRKGFYEVFASYKRFNKNSKMDAQDRSLIQFHLQSGIGYYHHLIMKIQSQFRLDLRGIVDFPLLVTDYGLKKDKHVWGNKPIESGGLEWAHNALHRCLIYLGDISRYLSDLEASYDHSFAQRYYSQALNWKPECGMPHNQLGTLASTQNYGLDAAYYYMRCLCCTQKFDGADGNLQHLFDNNAVTFEQLGRLPRIDNTPNVKKLLVTYIQVANCMFFDKHNAQLQQMCGDALTILETCIVEIESNLITVYNKCPVAEPAVLNDDILFKMLVISFMCIQQLKANGSSDTMGGVALSLALMSQLLNSVLKRLEAVLPPRLEPASKVKASKKGLRRRIKRRNNSVASDLSEDENDSVSVDSDISEEDLIFDCNDSDEDVINGIENGLHLNGHAEMNGNSKVKGFTELIDSSQPWTHPLVAQNKSYQHIHKLCNQGYIFQTLKVCCDWLASNNSFLKTCGTSTGPLITRLVNFLNHLSAVPSIESMKDLFDESTLTEDELCAIPLPEDVTVRGLGCLQTAHAKLNWDRLRTRILKPEEETYARIFKLIRFGSSMAESKLCALKYDSSRQWFSVETNGNKNGIKNNNAEKEPERPRVEKDRLKLMGELWLKSEVSQLENKAKKANLPPYIVPDMDVFLNHPNLLKQLVLSKKFIVLIPMNVVSGLDEYKGTSGRVRDTMRWLENQLRSGHRSLRLQRVNETLSVPYIKYPKKKDKEAWLFLQVVEFCNYVCRQSTGEKNPELVTLLTGSKTCLNGQSGFSHIGVAKSAGINVEHIESFFSKWKSCIKSHG